VVIINCRSSRRGREGFVRSCYSREDVDLVVGYSTEIERCYALSPDMFEGHAAISLRLSPTRNNQLVGVNWARDFEFERLDWSTLGAIAQLGERDAGSVEVAGSSPAGSTNRRFRMVSQLGNL
jgi:PD-(D/E)XK nuclease superfamily protein